MAVAKMVIRMWYDEEDNTDPLTGELYDKSSDMYYRDVEINVEMGKHGNGVSELHRVYSGFLKALGYPTDDIDELID
jgi:hypothetical protein